MASEIRNPELWPEGRLKIDWVRHHMPLLNGLEREFAQEKPFKASFHTGRCCGRTRARGAQCIRLVWRHF